MDEWDLLSVLLIILRGILGLRSIFLHFHVQCYDAHLGFTLRLSILCRLTVRCILENGPMPFSLLPTRILMEQARLIR